MIDQYKPNQFKLFVRNLVYKSLYTLDQALGRSNNVLVLCYHSVSNDNWQYSIDTEVFKKQILELKLRYDFITIEDLDNFLSEKKEFNKPVCLITFDDGYKDIYKLKEFLYKEEVKPIVFLLTEHKKVNRIALETTRPLLNKDEVCKLISLGWQIGSHTSSHSDLKNSNLASKKYQILNSRKDLESEYGKKVKYIAYPWGRYDKSTLSIVRKAKYKLGFTMNDGQISKITDPLCIPRVGIDRSHTGEIFLHTISPSVIAFRNKIKKILNFKI